MCDAARKFYFAVYKKLLDLNCVRSSVDYGLFSWYENGKLCGVLLSHVDDILWAGSESFKLKVIEPFCKLFSVRSQSANCFKYLGLNITQRFNENCIYVDQIEYVNNIEPIAVSNQRKKSKTDACNKDETSMFCKLVGKLNWVACQTRPDIAFDVCVLSSKMRSPIVENVLHANKVLSRIQSNPLTLKYGNLGDLNKVKVLCYTDASLGNLENGKSTEGYIVFLIGENNTVCPIVWKSKTIQRVVRSTLAAESNALVDGLDEGFFVSFTFNEVISGVIDMKPLSRFRNISSSKLLPIVAFTDNSSVFNNLRSTTMVAERRLCVDISAIKQMLENGEVTDVQWVPSDKQLADCLTKKGVNTIKLNAILESGKLMDF